MSKILITYSTTDGHTREICERLKMVVEAQGHEVRLEPIKDERLVDLEAFDKIVVGASIRYGKHRPAVYAFVRKYRDKLEGRPTAFFSVNVVARKPEKNQPETNPYLRKFLMQLSWQPSEVEVFAGKIDYPKYDFWDRQIIRLIMWITQGPTDPDAVVDFTDWARVDVFGRVIARM
jgi:menaquinone-dependent protoporphyrinogen oxidase